MDDESSETNKKMEGVTSEECTLDLEKIKEEQRSISEKSNSGLSELLCNLHGTIGANMMLFGKATMNIKRKYKSTTATKPSTGENKIPKIEESDDNIKLESKEHKEDTKQKETFNENQHDNKTEEINKNIPNLKKEVQSNVKQAETFDENQRDIKTEKINKNIHNLKEEVHSNVKQTETFNENQYDNKTEEINKSLPNLKEEKEILKNNVVDDDDDDDDDDDENDDSDYNYSEDSNVNSEENSGGNDDDDDLHSVFDESDRKLELKKLCKLCWENFPSKPILNRHMRRVHRQNRVPRFRCDPCNLDIETPGKFREHFSSCKFGYLQKNIHPCHLCEKIYSSTLYLSNHIRDLHDREKQSFPCNLCGKEFSKQKVLKHHLSMHKELWQSCPVCKKPVRKYNDLKKHMLTHQNKIPYFCLVCKAGFIEKNAFKKHKKTHKNKGKKLNIKKESVHSNNGTKNYTKGFNSNNSYNYKIHIKNEFKNQYDDSSDLSTPPVHKTDISNHYNQSRNSGRHEDHNFSSQNQMMDVSKIKTENTYTDDFQNEKKFTSNQESTNYEYKNFNERNCNNSWQHYGGYTHYNSGQYQNGGHYNHYGNSSTNYYNYPNQGNYEQNQSNTASFYQTNNYFQDQNRNNFNNSYSYTQTPNNFRYYNNVANPNHR